MGESVTKENGTDNNSGSTTKRKRASAANTSTTTDSGTGTGTGTGADIIGTDKPTKRSHHKKEEKLVGTDLVGQPANPVKVNVPGQPPAETPAPKPRTRKPTAKVNDLTQLEMNLEMVGAAAFGMVGFASGTPEVWDVTAPELKTISQPAARLIDRAGQSETTNKYTDWIMLMGALSLITIPRLMAMKAMQPAKVKKEVPANAGKVQSINREIQFADSPGIPPLDEGGFGAIYAQS